MDLSPFCMSQKKTDFNVNCGAHYDFYFEVNYYVVAHYDFYFEANYYVVRHFDIGNCLKM